MASITKRTLKDLPTKLQSSSVNYRKALCDDLVKIVVEGDPEEKEVPREAVIKGICKILPVVLPRYLDAKSRNAILKLVEALATVSESKVAFGALIASMLDTLSSWQCPNFEPTKSCAKQALFALKWTMVFAESLGLVTEPQKLVQLHAILISVIYGGGSQKQKDRCLEMFEQVWKDKGVDDYLTSYKKLEKNCHSLVLGATICDRMIKQDHSEALEMKKTLIEGIVATAIVTKTKPKDFMIRVRVNGGNRGPGIIFIFIFRVFIL